MNKMYIFILLFFVQFFSTIEISTGQCREYIESLVEEQLQPYTSDGNFVAETLGEGDSYQVTRTFNKGQSYKISICGMELFMIEMTITDPNKNVLFKNFGEDQEENTNTQTTDEGEEDGTENLGNRSWEFTPQQTVNLTISVKIPVITKNLKHRLEGCLGILIGFK